MDVPPGTTRVEMEGVGGGKEEITWQRYNGVRRSRFEGEAGEEREGSVVGGGKVREVDVVREREREREMVVDTRDRGRRFVAEKTKEDVMWTEITKDLVIREAIEESGYGFEETEFFFYVMEYLRYVSFSPFPLFGVFFFFFSPHPPAFLPPLFPSSPKGHLAISFARRPCRLVFRLLDCVWGGKSRLETEIGLAR